MGSSQGGYTSVREGEKNALSDVVDIMGFNFGHGIPILLKNEKCQKKANHEGGASFIFDPSNRYVPLVKGPKKAVSGGKMVDLGGPKRKTPHLRDSLFLTFFGFS